MLTINLQYIADEFRELMLHVCIDDHSKVMDAYFNLCKRANIGDKTAVQTLTPSITDEEYYKDFTD